MDPSEPDSRFRLRNIDIRRALLAVLVDTDLPLTVDDIVGRLERDHSWRVLRDRFVRSRIAGPVASPHGRTADCG